MRPEGDCAVVIARLQCNGSIALQPCNQIPDENVGIQGRGIEDCGLRIRALRSGESLH